MVDSIKELFNSWAGTERGERMATGHDVLVKQIFVKWRNEDIPFILDAGCGNGRALMTAKEKGAQKLAGIDVSEQMIVEAKKNLPEAELYVTPMQELKMWGDDTFSHIMSIEALYYLQDPLEGLKELRRVLKPDGKIAVAIDYYGESKGSHSWADALPFDITLLNEREWVALFKEAGFDDIASSRILRMEHIKTEEEFEPSSFFPNYEAYQDYIASGALLLSN